MKNNFFVPNAKQFWKVFKFNLTALVLAIVLFVVFLPSSLVAYASDKLVNSAGGDAVVSEDGGSQDLAPTPETEESVPIEQKSNLIEDEEATLRTRNAKYYVTEKTDVIEKRFTYDVHYKEGETWKEIDNSLDETANSYKTKGNPFNYEFGKNSEYDLKINKGGIEISFKYISKKANNGNGNTNRVSDNSANDFEIIETNNADIFDANTEKFKDTEKKNKAAKSIKNTKNKIVNKNKDDYTNIEYELTGSTLKENIVVSNVLGVKDTYTFQLDISNNGLLEINLNGDIEIYDSGSNVAMVIPKGFMVDNSNVVSNDVNYRIEYKNKNRTYLHIDVDTDWMKAEARTFPIKIDPTIEDPGIDETQFYTLYKNKGGIQFSDKALIGDIANYAIGVYMDIDFIFGETKTVKQQLDIYFEKDIAQDMIIYGNCGDDVLSAASRQYNLTSSAQAISQGIVQGTQRQYQCNFIPAGYMSFNVFFAHYKDDWQPYNQATGVVLTSTFELSANNYIGRPVLENDLGKFGKLKIDTGTVQESYSANLINMPIGSVPMYLSMIVRSQDLFVPGIGGGMTTNFAQRLLKLGENYGYFLPDGRVYIVEPFQQSDYRPEIQYGQDKRTSMHVFDDGLSYHLIDLQRNRLVFDRNTNLLKSIIAPSGDSITIDYCPRLEFIQEDNTRAVVNYGIDKITDSNGHIYKFNYSTQEEYLVIERTIQNITKKVAGKADKQLISFTKNNTHIKNFFGDADQTMTIDFVSADSDRESINFGTDGSDLTNIALDNNKHIKLSSNIDYLNIKQLNREGATDTLIRERQFYRHDNMTEVKEDGVSTGYYFNNKINQNAHIFASGSYVGKASTINEDADGNKIKVLSATATQNGTNLGFSNIHADETVVGVDSCNTVDWWLDRATASVTTDKYVDNGATTNSSLKVSSSGGYFDRLFWVNNSATHEFVISLWMYKESNANISLQMIMRNEGDTSQDKRVNIDIANVYNQWQLVTFTLPTYDLGTQMNILYFCFSGVSGNIYLDEIKVNKILRQTTTDIRQDTYDRNHNIIKKKDYNPISGEYDVTEYSYESGGLQALVSEIIYPNGIKVNYLYNDLNQIVEERSTNGEVTEKTTYTYDSANRLMTETTNGVTTTYAYDIDNCTVTISAGNYTYTTKYATDFGSIDSVAVGGVLATSQVYTYTQNGSLDTITQNGLTVDYNYNANSQVNDIKIGNQSYVGYTYNQARPSQLDSVNYSNGQNLQYAYDPTTKQLLTVSQNGTLLYRYNYNVLGELTSMDDLVNGISQTYSSITNAYGSTTTYQVVNNEGIGNYSVYTADGRRVTNMNYTTKNDDYLRRHMQYTYNATQSNRIDGMNIWNEATNTSRSYSYGYDGLNRLSTFNDGGGYSERYFYSTEGNLLYRKEYYVNGVLYHGNQLGYNAQGRIASVRTVDGNFNIYSYEYDNLGRVTREDNWDTQKTYVMTYDTVNYLNIKEVKTYSFTASGTTPTAMQKRVVYTYSTVRNDQLTAIATYNGEGVLDTANSFSIAYDNMGNPTSYKQKELSWTQGTKLASYGDVSFTYNADGMRYSKTQGINKTKYFYEGTRLFGEMKYTTTAPDAYQMIWYYYDNEGVRGMEYNGQIYTFMKNQLGDIAAIYDKDGNQICTYRYDLWGKTEVASGSVEIGNANPFRYRSYYYDTQTQLYYMPSRYYDPSLGRFISSDTPTILNGLIGTSGAMNLYAYCFNDPINFTDEGGNFVLATFLTFVVIGAIIGAAVGGLNAHLSGDSVWKGALLGGVFGALSGVVGYFVGTPSLLIGAALNGAETAVGALVNGDDLGSSDVWADIGISIGLGVITGVAADFIKFPNLGDKLEKIESAAVGSILNGMVSTCKSAIESLLKKQTASYIVTTPKNTRNYGFETQADNIAWYYCF